MDRLQLLKQLFEDGFIGHEEFITRKTQLIDDLTFTRSSPLNNNINSHHAATNLKDVNITTTINPRSTHDADDLPLSPKTPDLLFESFFPDSPITTSCAASTVDPFPPLLSPSSPFFTDLLCAPTSTCATTTNTTTASLGSSTTVVEGDNDDCAAFLLYDDILTSDCQHRTQTTVACHDNDHGVTVAEKTRDVEKSKDSTASSTTTTTIDSALSHDDLLALSPSLSPISSSQVTPGTLFEMSVEQKKQMIEKLKQLSRVSQVKILQFLQMKSPSQLQKNDSLDEYTCDLGCVDNQTCLTLYHMITELEMLELYQSNVQYYQQQQQQQQQQYFPFYSAFATMNPSMDLASSYSNNLQPWYNQSQYSSSMPNMMMMNTLETPQPENNNQSKKKRRRNVHDKDDDDDEQETVNKKQRMNTNGDQQSEQLPKKKHASDEWPLIDSCSHDHQPVSHLDASDVCSFMLPTTTMNCEQALWKPSKTSPSQQLTSDTTTLYTNPSCSDTVDCGSSLHPPENNQEDPAKKKFTITLEIHTFDKADDTNKPYHCDTCGKRFKDRSNLAKHIRVHTKEKPFTCDICGNSYAHSQTLREHMFVHRKDEHDNTVAAKPFQCTFKSCNKTFANEANLRRHMRTHTKEQPYECHLCERSFSQSGNLKTHLKLVHQLIVDKITKKEQKHKRMLRLTKSLDME